MQTKKVDTGRPEIKRMHAGGETARAIYSTGGLADRLRRARHHNTADRSMGIGRPAQNEDGTRTYRLALEPSDEPAPQEQCPRCGQSHGDPGQEVVHGLLITCHHPFHEPVNKQDPTGPGGGDIVYFGTRHPLIGFRFEDDTQFVRGERWSVLVGPGGQPLPRRRDLVDLAPIWRWGGPSLTLAHYQLAVDLLAHAVGDAKTLEAYKAFGRHIIPHLISPWTLNQGRIAAMVDWLLEHGGGDPADNDDRQTLIVHIVEGSQ